MAAEMSRDGNGRTGKFARTGVSARSQAFRCQRTVHITPQLNAMRYMVIQARSEVGGESGV